LFIARGLSFIALKDFRSAVSDFDDAVEIDGRSLEAWTSRGLAFERMGNKEQAAASYQRAMSINEQYAPAREGFRRVGGRVGQSYSLN
jgi:Tfp pilus assembly protein PilF